MNYKRIEPLAEPDQYWHSEELHALHNVWYDKKQELVDSGNFITFNTRLKREWAIETGLIERLYYWDREVTETLLDQGIDASILVHQAKLSQHESERTRLLIQDQGSVLEGLFQVIKEERPITEHFIRTLHNNSLNTRIQQRR